LGETILDKSLFKESSVLIYNIENLFTLVFELSRTREGNLKKFGGKPINYSASSVYFPEF
jgi:hypothetical protein